MTEKNVMPPLKYHDDIDIHVPKVAHIYWTPGKQAAHELSNNVSMTTGGSGIAGLVGALVATSIQEHHRKNNPSQYLREYGKADEAVFITSLRDVLVEQDVFKNVELTNDLSKISPNDVVIKVYFKSTRITFKYDYIITLTVNLSIQANNRPLYERTFLIQNNTPEPAFTFKSKTFTEIKTEVSQKLLVSILNGIKQWHRGNK